MAETLTGKERIKVSLRHTHGMKTRVIKNSRGRTYSVWECPLCPVVLTSRNLWHVQKHTTTARHISALQMHKTLKEIKGKDDERYIADLER